MGRNIKKTIFLIGLMMLLLNVITITNSNGQELEITNLQFANEKIVIHYDLKDSVINKYYTVQLYSSYDNYLNPLINVNGDVGLEIKPGDRRRLEWDVKKELGEFYQGKVSLELRSKIFIPFINMEGFEEIMVLKRGREYNVTWTGGRPQNVLNFDLYRDEKKVHTFANIANAGHYQLTIPKFIKPGNDYYFKVSDAKNKDEVIFTEKFILKRKVPLLLKAIPIIVVSAIASVLLQSDPQTDNSIGDPPLITSSN